MRDLEKQFGIKPAPTKSSYTCSACHQRHHADAPTDWTKTIYYSKAVAGVGEVNAYEVEGGEGNFRWEYVSEDGGDSDADEDRIYITLSAACDAAKAHLEGQVEWYKKIAKEEQENGE
jgi:transcription elongation factor Elf1